MGEREEAREGTSRQESKEEGLGGRREVDGEGEREREEVGTGEKGREVGEMGEEAWEEMGREEEEEGEGEGDIQRISEVDLVDLKAIPAREGGVVGA